MIGAPLWEVEHRQMLRERILRFPRIRPATPTSRSCRCAPASADGESPARHGHSRTGVKISSRQAAEAEDRVELDPVRCHAGLPHLPRRVTLLIQVKRALPARGAVVGAGNGDRLPESSAGQTVSWRQSVRPMCISVGTILPTEAPRDPQIRRKPGGRPPLPTARQRGQALVIVRCCGVLSTG